MPEKMRRMHVQCTCHDSWAPNALSSKARTPKAKKRDLTISTRVLPTSTAEKRPRISSPTTMAVPHIAAAFLVSASKLHGNPSILSDNRLLLLRGFLLLSLRLLSLLLSPILSLIASLPVPPPSPPSSAAPAARALSHVLFALTRVPVASRKYEPLRSLADRILDDNLRTCGLDRLNRAALSDAFSHTLHLLEAILSASAPAEGSFGAIAGAVRRWTAPAEEEEGLPAAEKLAAELLWLAEKMEACGAAREAAARWAAAAGLSRLALSGDPRIQVAFVRISVFLFKQTNAKQVDRESDEGLEEKECAIAHYRMAMLTTWLPLLCRACNGTDTPVLSSVERSEMVRVLEELIQKLSWDQQEVVLALWLHHFTSCSNSDWPNLESCYMRWYAESRKLFLTN